MSRPLTKAEKAAIKLDALIDAHQWTLTGTLCPTPKRIPPEELKRRVKDNPFAKSKFLHGRNVVIINANIWAEQVIYGDENES